MERIHETPIVVDTGGTGKESLPPVANKVHAAIAEATPEAIQPCDERGMDAGEAEAAYNGLYEQTYPAVGQPVHVTNDMLATWHTFGEDTEPMPVQSQEPSVDHDSW